jgi:hypothetical protein
MRTVRVAVDAHSPVPADCTPPPPAPLYLSTHIHALAHAPVPAASKSFRRITTGPFRAYPEMFHSGALTAEQTDAMYISGQGRTTCAVGRWLSDGSPSSGDGLIFVHTPQGLPFGLLVHDMVERFLLYFFHQSAHANTRGTFTTPECTDVLKMDAVF